MSTLYVNAHVQTMDPTVGETDAFLVSDGTFAAVGDEARERAGSATVVDLEGRTVVPGIIDSHTHMETSAVSQAMWVDVREKPLDEVLRIMTEYAATRPAGEWIIGQGTFGEDGQAPTIAQLDAVSDRHPVIYRPTMHVQIGNTRALQAAGILTSKTAPVGVHVERHADGTPTGLVREGFHLFPIDLPGREEMATIIETEIREHFNRFGVTTIYEVPFSKPGVQGFQHLAATGRLTARIALQPTIRPGLQPLVDDISHWANMGLMSGFGSDMLWLGAAKFFLDGADEVSWSIDRDREHPSRWGGQTRLFPELVRSLVIGYENGIQFWIHALGLDAQYQAMDAIEEAQRLVGGHHGLRTRIEHLGLDFPIPDSIMSRLAKHNVIGVPTAAFIHGSPPSGAFAFRTLIDAGFTPPGNSDNAGSQPFATSPWFGFKKMLTRTNKHGVPVSPEEKITVYEALRCYTEFAAYSGHREDTLGSIRAGKLADFAVLNKNPLTTPDEEMDSIESLLTVVGGKTVWEQSC